MDSNCTLSVSTAMALHFSTVREHRPFPSAMNLSFQSWNVAGEMLRLRHNLAADVLVFKNSSTILTFPCGVHLSLIPILLPRAKKHSDLIGFILAGSCPLHLTGFQTDSLYLAQHISCFAFLPPTPLGFQTLQADQ